VSGLVGVVFVWKFVEIFFKDGGTECSIGWKEWVMVLRNGARSQIVVHEL
jgi:hypothetical protein